MPSVVQQNGLHSLELENSDAVALLTDTALNVRLICSVFQCFFTLGYTVPTVEPLGNVHQDRWDQEHLR